MVLTSLCWALCDWATPFACPGHCIYSLNCEALVLYYGLCLHLFMENPQQGELKLHFWIQQRSSAGDPFLLNRETHVSLLLSVAWRVLFTQQATLAGQPYDLESVGFLVSKHWHVGKSILIFWEILQLESLWRILKWRSPTSRSEAAGCVKGAGWVQGNPEAPLEKRMHCYCSPAEETLWSCWASQRVRERVICIFCTSREMQS